MKIQQESILKNTDLHQEGFVAMLAHELRNPLMSIGNALAFWKAGEASAKEINEVQEAMSRQLQQIVQTIDDLVDIDSITHGTIICEEEPVDLLDVINYAVERSRQNFLSRQQKISLSLPEEAVFVKGDFVRLQQVVCKLLDNASKYTSAHGHIAVMLACEEGNAIIRVIDDGVGISPELLPHIFIFDQLFQSKQSLDRHQGGLGLGLKLVRFFVELQGGTVDAKSAGLKKGSELIVRLPMMKSGVDVALLPTSPVMPENAPLTQSRILIVDDNIDALKTTQMLLKLQRHQVETAVDGPSGIKTAMTFKPEIILLDIGMPGMDGYEVARRLRELPETKNTLLIALSGYGQAEDHRKSKEAGFNHHLVKPAEINQLEALISDFKSTAVKFKKD